MIDTTIGRPGTGRAPAGRPATHEMTVVHRVFRRESRLLPELVRAVPAGDIARARLVGGHVRDYLTELRFHQSGEDELLWPLLLRRVDARAGAVHRMLAGREEIAGYLDLAGRALARWEMTGSAADRDELAGVLHAHRRVLIAHLNEEERALMPLVRQTLTAREWDRLGARRARRTPRNRVLSFIGAVLEDADRVERAHMLGTMPWRARLAWYTVGRRRYERRMRRIRQIR